MRIISLQLRNYRVYRTLDIELPGGVVGVYGANGSGKSSLLESVMWALFGKARTQKQQIPSVGASGECSATVTFEHDGHHYVVKRSISGQAFTVKARVTLGDQVAADGPTDVDRFMQSILGMDATSFRASVFAEQKQLAAFSDQAPDKRRQMVLQLLGITPVERARDKARTEGRELQQQLDRATPLVSNLAEVESKVVEVEASLAPLIDDAATALAKVGLAEDNALRAGQAVQALIEARAADSAIREQGASIRRQLDDVGARVESGRAELVQLDELLPQLDALDAASLTIETLQNRSAVLVSLHQARDRLEKLPMPVAVTGPSAEDLAAARAAKEQCSANHAELQGRSQAATDRVSAATAEDRLTAALDGHSGCPLCGQELGTSVEQMRAHRHEELIKAQATQDAVQQQLRFAASQLAEARKTSEKLEAQFVRSAAEAEKVSRIMAQRSAAQSMVEEALVVAGGEPAPDEPQRLTADLKAAQLAATQSASLRAKLERRVIIEAENGRLVAQQVALTAERQVLLNKLREVSFQPEEFQRLSAAGTVSTTEAQSARRIASEAAQALAAQRARAEGAREQFDKAQAQHATLEGLRQQAAVLLRAAALLHEFRQYIVGLVGPQLETQASSLFNQLTGGEYDGLQVDPDSYELKIVDHGMALPTSRFSGSEVDLANLALRVAISEQVRFQAGGQVGLLVLDEALSSLDADRKDRTLAALAQLGGRFQQILVVTHAPEVKDLLPSAIEVRRLQNRQSTAEVLGAN
jgi:DNA repair protein SbcC/Rad50